METPPTTSTQKLPNDPLALILAISSIVLACCCGFFSLIPAIIGFVMANKGMKEYEANPDGYAAGSFSNMKTARIIAIIGIVLGVLSLLYGIFMIATLGIDGYQEQMRDILG
ncbi:MAG: CD225/dispanin family protein [Saprospiraceae bacterium]|nr:CD225/dispanin family protein [Saprospiraceae bacterium]